MTLEYTYDTYASNYVINENTINALLNSDKDQLRNQLITISNLLMIRLGLFADIPEGGSRPVGFSAFFMLYKVTDNENRAAFFFLKENSSSVTDFDIYRVECQITLVEGELKITGCKTYYTPSQFARQNITFAGINDDYVFIGVCGRVPNENDSEEDRIATLLSGFSYDIVNNIPSEKSCIITPPKSFFVEGEHENFAPVGKYPLVFCDEC